MKPMPDADEHRRLGKIEADKARKLQPGTKKEGHLEKARNHESSASSEDWRGCDLRAPEFAAGTFQIRATSPRYTPLTRGPPLQLGSLRPDGAERRRSA